MDIIGMFKNLENALDAASLRQQVIANNIANATNPSFKGQSVAFEDEFQKALDAKNGKDDLGGVQAVSLEDDGFTIGGGGTESVRGKVVSTGKNVDMNQEMVHLAQNQIHYNMLADKLGGFMSSVQTVIESTGK